MDLLRRFLLGNNNVEAPPPDVMDIKMEDDSTQFKEQFQDQFKGNNEENDSECNKISEVDLHNQELSIKDEFLSDSLNILSNDLFSFFGSNELSDFNVILKTGESLPCHQFMLQARCPNLLSDILRSEDSNSLDFTQYSSKATRAFFRYIYTGKLDFVYSLPYEDKSDLYVLAKKYQLEFLENFLLKSFSADSFHVYSQSTCSPPQSPKASPDTSYGAKEDIVNKDKKLTSLAQESFQKDKETFSILKENQSMGLSFANLNETINNFASTSGLNSFKNNSERTPSNTDQSLYDIFKDEIKSPCNSSLLFPGFQSKRKLDYTDVLKETKKICSVKDPIKLEKSPEIVTIDSDSNIECLSISGSSSQSHSEGLNNFFKVENLSKSINEDLFQNSVINSDLNLGNYFSKPNEEDRTKETEISPLKSPPDSNKSSSPAIASPAPVLTSNKRSIDKYFEASFPDEVDEDIEVIEKFSQQKALATPPVNKNLSKKLLTPLQEIIVGKATPKPNYEAMISPDLKDELRKYGIKPNLDPKKARSLLQYIYEQIHPIRADLPKPVETPQASTSSARPVSPVPVIDIKDESSQSDSSDKWKNSENDFEYEEQLFNQSKVEHEFSTDKIEPRESDLRKTIADFIKSNKELFSNVVLFRPLLFKKFYSSVREHGIKCSIYELMDVLDDLCINYHVEKKENSRQKRRTKKKTVKKKPTKTS